MTVLGTSASSGPYTPNGSTAAFPFDFTAISGSEVQVVRRAADGTDTALGGYSVVLDNVDGGGTVNFTDAPAAGDPIYILSDPSFEQQISFETQGKFSPKSLDEAFDRAAVRDIALKAQIDSLSEDLPAAAAAVVDAEAAAAVAEAIANAQIGGSDFYDARANGAKGDSNAGGALGTDDHSALQAGLNAVAAQGGGTYYLRHGYYKSSSYLTVPKNVKVKGESRTGSVIVFTNAGGGGANATENLRNGSGFRSVQAINSSIIVDNDYEDFSVVNVNGSNQGAGFYDTGGTHLYFRNVGVVGFKYDIVLEQSETVTIDHCYLAASISGGACVWLVNGADLTVGASAGFTNDIKIQHCDFQMGSGTIGVLDDGGYAHSILRNNFNGGSNHIRAAGVAPLLIQNSEHEGGSGHYIVLDSLTRAGASVGGGFTKIDGGEFNVSSGHSAIHGQNSPGELEVSGIAFFSGGGGTEPITGSGLFTAIWLYSYANQSGSPAAVKDGTAQYHDVDLVDGGKILRSSPLTINRLNLTPQSSVTPANNGDMQFELTNDTTVKIKVKGSDGVVRSWTGTLA